jgi:hypothetical protein
MRMPKPAELATAALLFASPAMERQEVILPSMGAIVMGPGAPRLDDYADSTLQTSRVSDQILNIAMVTTATSTSSMVPTSTGTSPLAPLRLVAGSA